MSFVSRHLVPGPARLRRRCLLCGVLLPPLAWGLLCAAPAHAADPPAAAQPPAGPAAPPAAGAAGRPAPAGPAGGPGGGGGGGGRGGRLPVLCVKSS